MNVAKAQKGIKEFDSIRLTVALEGADVFNDSRIFPLPIGTEGAVVHIFGGYDAFEVEFHIHETADPEDITYVQIPVRLDQCEPVEPER